MKKLTLLLGALALVSSAAYAKEVVPAVEETVVVEESSVVASAPSLTVTSIGQYLEFDNTSGSSDIGETVFFGNKVDLAYGDNWTIHLLGAKMWNIDTDDGIHSDNHRLELGAWRHFENASLGFKWRGQSSYDRYYLRAKYNYGAFLGDLDVAYQSTNSSEGRKGGERDGWYIEGTPLGVQVGPLTFGYYVKSESNVAVGSDSDAEIDYWFRHQLRVGMPVYQGEKLNVGVQYGWEFANNMELGDSDKYHAYKHDNNTHCVWLTASYAVTDSLTIDGYYEYDMYKWEKEGSGATKTADSQRSNDDDNYYGEFYIGWTYTF